MRKEGAILDHQTKMQEMGRVATALLQLHLKKPKQFGPRTFVNELFNKFEELDLEEEEV